MERSLLEQTETMDDARKIVRVLAEFSRGLGILDDYDHRKLEHTGISAGPAVVITPGEFMIDAKEIYKVLKQDAV